MRARLSAHQRVRGFKAMSMGIASKLEFCQMRGCVPKRQRLPGHANHHPHGGPRIGDTIRRIHRGFGRLFVEGASRRSAAPSNKADRQVW